MVIAIDHVNAKIDSRSLHEKCVKAFQPKWAEWTGGQVPLHLSDTALHHKSRMTTISPPAQNSDGEDQRSQNEDMPLYSLCFSGRSPRRFSSVEIPLQLEVFEKTYFQGFIAHSQLAPDLEGGELSMKQSSVPKPRPKPRPKASRNNQVHLYNT